MKIYVQFLQVHNGNLCEICGTDGVFILDGRNKRLTHIEAIMKRIYKLRILKICGYRVYRGTRFDDGNELIKEWVRSGTLYTSGNKYKEATNNW